MQMTHFALSPISMGQANRAGSRPGLIEFNQQSVERPVRNDLDLDPYIDQQLIQDSRTRRRFGREILGEDRIEAGEIYMAAQPHHGLHYVRQLAAGLRKGRFDCLERDARLLLDGTSSYRLVTSARHLACQIDEVAGSEST
jgi:hypothetical protein